MRMAVRFMESGSDLLDLYDANGIAAARGV